MRATLAGSYELISSAGCREILRIRRACYDRRVSAGVEESEGTAAEVKPKPEPEWPEHFPAKCPPAAASPTNGRVFRRDCGPVDWVSYLERGLNPNKPPCGRAALSCCTSLDDLRQRMKVREEWENCKIVAATLSPEHGVILQTGKDVAHHSLWLRRKAHASIKELFRAVE